MGRITGRQRLPVGPSGFFGVWAAVAGVVKASWMGNLRLVTVHRSQGLRVVTFIGDHLPAHVQVFGDRQATTDLGRPGWRAGGLLRRRSLVRLRCAMTPAAVGRSSNSPTAAPSPSPPNSPRGWRGVRRRPSHPRPLGRSLGHQKPARPPSHLRSQGHRCQKQRLQRRSAVAVGCVGREKGSRNLFEEV